MKALSRRGGIILGVWILALNVGNVILNLWLGNSGAVALSAIGVIVAAICLPVWIVRRHGG